MSGDTRPTLNELWPGAIGARRRMTPAENAWLRDATRGSTIGVFGATGAVGLEVLALLREIDFPAAEIRAFGSERSAGTTLAYGEANVPVEPTDAWLQGIPLSVAVLATPTDTARALAPALRASGIPVSDNSSAFRLDPGAALVIPEINADSSAHNSTGSGSALLASPNCTTTIALTAAEPVRRAWGVRALSVASYQAVSGAGLEAMRALVVNTTEFLSGATPADRFAGFNAFPHESPVDAEGWCEEENKLRHETARLWGIDPARVRGTCVRVPVLRTHLVAVTLHTERATDRSKAERAIREGAGVELCEHGPAALDASGRCAVQVGRVVVEDDLDGPGSVVRFVAAGDQLLKGAAWNALQNAGLLLSRARRVTRTG